jgi:hypothetical protein
MRFAPMSNSYVLDEFVDQEFELMETGDAQDAQPIVDVERSDANHCEISTTTVKDKDVSNDNIKEGTELIEQEDDENQNNQSDEAEVHEQQVSNENEETPVLENINIVEFMNTELTVPNMPLSELQSCRQSKLRAGMEYLAKGAQYMCLYNNLGSKYEEEILTENTLLKEQLSSIEQKFAQEQTQLRNEFERESNLQKRSIDELTEKQGETETLLLSEMNKRTKFSREVESFLTEQDAKESHLVSNVENVIQQLVEEIASQRKESTDFIRKTLEKLM